MSRGLMDIKRNDVLQGEKNIKLITRFISKKQHQKTTPGYIYVHPSPGIKIAKRLFEKTSDQRQRECALHNHYINACL